MERSTPVRKPNISTADLLTWPENQPFDSPAADSRSAIRSHQPSDGIRKVVFGGQVTDEEFASLNKRKPCSTHKMKEITGSGIFSAFEEDNSSEAGSMNPTPNGKTRVYKQGVASISHITFGEEEIVTPKKPTSFPEVAKQRELSGTIDYDNDAMLKKQISDAKCKELSGHDIFAPPPEIEPRSTVRALALKDNFDLGEPGDANGKDEFMVKTSKKIPDRKFIDLSGNNIFKGDIPTPTSAERLLSTAKLREISGNNIFADAKVEYRDSLGGVRKPPGGESSIALV